MSETKALEGTPRPRLAQAALCAMAMGGVLGVGATALASMSVGAGTASGPVLVVAPPWRDLEDLAERAGARLVGPFSAPIAAFVQSTGRPSADPAGVRSGPPPPDAASDLAERLKTAGAWFALDAAALAQLCGAAE